MVITLLFSENLPPPSATVIPGIARIKSCMFTKLASSISLPEIAEMLKGISLVFISRRVAVTTISSRDADSCANDALGCKSEEEAIASAEIIFFCGRFLAFIA